MTEQENKIQILIVDDSSVVRAIWSKLVNSQSDMCVSGTAAHGLDALEFLKNHHIDLILLDIDMPEMDGLTLLPLVRKQYPNIKIIMVSSLTIKGTETTVKSLVLGASDYITKPISLEHSSEVEKQLLEKIRNLISKTNSAHSITNNPAVQKTNLEMLKAEALVIGSSTGGPNALVNFLKALPLSFNLPILIVQHMPKNFITALAERISKDTSRFCHEARTGEAIQRGQIYLAPGDLHMIVEGPSTKPIIRLLDCPEENYCKPAVDQLFRSAARTYGAKLIGLVLTGMGEDGKLGCIEISKHKGVIFAQDEASSVVWGMPGAAVSTGLVSQTGSPENLAQLIAQLVKAK